MGVKDPTTELELIIMPKKWAEEGTQQKAGDGWLGSGAPIKVHQGHRIRDLEDGAGICSPGRWKRHRRRLPDTEGLAKMVIEKMCMGEEHWSKSVLKMMAGKQAESPFAKEEILRGRECLTNWLEAKGFACTETRRTWNKHRD